MPRISVRMRSHKGRFCKTIGIAIGRIGKPTRKVFYFPPNDPATAFRRILELQGDRTDNPMNNKASDIIKDIRSCSLRREFSHPTAIQ
jgi:hypothetical protein